VSADKIKVKQITLIHATGANDLGQGLANGVIAGTTKIVESYDEATQVLVEWQGINLPGHFNDIDWKITFEDGFEKSGTYELGKPKHEAGERPDFIDAITYMSLKLTSDDPADAAFQKMYDREGKHREMAQHMLSTYDHGLDEAPALKI
jgi:hypothetical protein